MALEPKQAIGPLDLKRKRYAEPPIEEAVCELRFADSSWNPTIPGVYYQRIKREYSAQPVEVGGIEATIEQTPTTLPNVSVRQSPSRTRFSTADETNLIHLGPTSLTINRLRPYERWEAFKAQIDHALGAYFEVMGTISVTRIGVRYINKVLIPIKPDELVQLQRYFTCHPQDLSEIEHGDMPDQLLGVISKQLYGWDSSVRMMRTFALTEAPEGHVGFLLDIDVFRSFSPTSESRAWDVSALGVIIDNLRAKERVAFEASITNECRKLFGN